MKKRILRLFVTVMLFCMALTLSACSNEESDPSVAGTETESSETVPVTTQAPTEPQPVYETQTQYLCVLETMTNYENNSVFKTAKSYDEFGRLAAQWRVQDDGSKGSVTSYIYDELGNNIEETSEYGRYEMAYDEEGRLLSRCYYSGEECKSEYHYTYNDAGFVIEEVRITRYSEETIDTYKITYNDTHTEGYVERYTGEEKTSYTKETYNGDGMVLTSNTYDTSGTWRSGSTYEYDDQGRLVLESCYSSSDTQADYDIIYTYDENGLLLSKNVDYYYGYLMEYTYEPFDILVRVN